MADTEEQPEGAADAKADAIALAEEAEAEAAEAEALAAAARARARAIRLRREAETQTAAEEVTTHASEAADTVEETSPEPASTEPAAASSKPPRRRMARTLLALMVAAIVGICGLLGLSGYMIWHHHHADAQRQQAAAFVAAAKQGVTNLMSLDFNKAKQDVQRILDSSTGEFKDDFQQRAADFTTVVQESKVVTEGSAKETGIQSMTKDSAVVLVLANERVTNSAGAKEEPRAFRLRVSVARDGDQIKMSKVEFVL